MRIVVAMLASFVLAAPAFADVTVIDGDTIKVDGTTHRLWGIDAPEYRQGEAQGLKIQAKEHT